jgi:hypothetical protein
VRPQVVDGLPNYVELAVPDSLQGVDRRSGLTGKLRNLLSEDLHSFFSGNEILLGISNQGG